MEPAAFVLICLIFFVILAYFVLANSKLQSQFDATRKDANNLRDRHLERDREFEAVEKAFPGVADFRKLYSRVDSTRSSWLHWSEPTDDSPLTRRERYNLKRRYTRFVELAAEFVPFLDVTNRKQ